MDVREVVVVCYGNICRSPMGEALIQRALDERMGEGAVLVSSAGIGADDGHPPSRGTVDAMALRGIDVRRLRSAYLSGTWAARAWRIYCMEAYQVDHVRAMLGGDGAKVSLMAGEEVPDPLGSGQAAYEAVAVQIERLLPLVVDEIASAITTEA